MWRQKIIVSALAREGVTVKPTAPSLVTELGWFEAAKSAGEAYRTAQNGGVAMEPKALPTVHYIPFHFITRPLFMVHSNRKGKWDCTHICFFPAFWETLWESLAYAFAADPATAAGMGPQMMQYLAELTLPGSIHGKNVSDVCV